MENFTRFNEEKLPVKKYFYRSVKDRTSGDNGENLRWSDKQWRLFDIQQNVEWI